MNRTLWGWIIILSALLVEVPRFMVINWRIEGLTNEPASWIGAAVGSGMGLVVPLGTAYVFDAWRSTRKDARAWKILLVAFVSFLISEALMLTPYVESGIRGLQIVDVLAVPWMRTLWSLVTALAPLSIVAGVAYAMPSGKTASHSKRSATAQQPQSERKKVACEYCETLFGSQNALNAHRRFCVPSNGKVTEKISDLEELEHA